MQGSHQVGFKVHNWVLETCSDGNLSRQMIDCTGASYGIIDRASIADVRLCKLKAAGIVALQFSYVLLHAGTAKIIEDVNRLIFGEVAARQVSADKTSAAGYENIRSFHV